MHESSFDPPKNPEALGRDGAVLGWPGGPQGGPREGPGRSGLGFSVWSSLTACSGEASQPHLLNSPTWGGEALGSHPRLTRTGLPVK